MVKSNEIFVIAALAAILFAPAVTAASEASSGYSKFIELCQKKMTPECGKEIFSGMFYDDHPRPQSVTEACCIRLVVGMGRPCHDALFEQLLQNPEIKPISSFNKAWLRFRSDQIWDDCVSVSIAQSPSS